eukprot:652023-Rhodomonas_salina.4
MPSTSSLSRSDSRQDELGVEGGSLSLSHTHTHTTHRAGHASPSWSRSHTHDTHDTHTNTTHKRARTHTQDEGGAEGLGSDSEKMRLGLRVGGSDAEKMRLRLRGGVRTQRR